MKIKNLKVKPKFVALALTGTLIATALTGCNYDVIDTKYNFNKAIIFDDDSATIIDIKKWKDYDGEQIQIQTPDDIYILTSSYDTKLIDDKNSEVKAEDLVRAILGDDAEINYLKADEDKVK